MSSMKAPCATQAKFSRESGGHGAVQQAVHKVEGESITVSYDVVGVALWHRAEMVLRTFIRLNGSMTVEQ